MKQEEAMDNRALADFIESLYEDVVEAMKDADSDPVDLQYRLGVRRLAWAFFNKLELFGLEDILPNLDIRDVDAWFAGRERQQ